MKKISLLIVIVFILSCQMEFKINDSDNYKEEIINAEHNFAKMASEEGIEKAFTTFAAPDAVILRKQKLIKGIDSIRSFYANREKVSEKLEWEPEFVDVAKSGDLGYTFGKYTYTLIDSAGIETKSEGVFHTVWKKQPDRSWKFVWD